MSAWWRRVVLRQPEPLAWMVPRPKSVCPDRVEPVYTFAEA